LTQTSKKTREHKSNIIRDVRETIDDHDAIYLFSYENMRSNKFKKIRMDFRQPDMEGRRSRVFLGKNKLMQIALGRTTEDEYSENLRHLSKLIVGNVGLLMTSKPDTEVEEYFNNFAEDDFARAGATATRTVTVNNEMLYNFPSSMVEQFRKLNLPVDIDNGKLVLTGGKKEHTICEEGDELSVEACKLLVQFGVKLTEFRVKLLCRWKSTDNSFEKF
jgi:mRNA turnover protein 4